jgi:hypothetical protein
MSKEDRLKLIRQIQKVRGSYLITYITSTRPGLEVPMAMDSIRRIYDHLVAHKKPKVGKLNIDLFLHSNGGDGTVPWRLVTLIREYADHFNVLVPFRAFSAATLAALGADSIVMHPMGMLGPTDPTVANPFNPADPSNPQKRIGISVEDVTAYIALVKEDAGIQHEDELVQAFLKLAEQVHPLALGNIKRSISQSRMMAKKLLSTHMDASTEDHRIEEIVDNLTSKLFYHGHPINRREAKDQLGLSTVEYASGELERAIWDLYLHYENEINMEVPFSAISEFTSQNPSLSPGAMALTTESKAKLVFVESVSRTDVFALKYQLSGQKQPNGSTSVTMITLGQGWETE